MSDDFPNSYGHGYRVIRSCPDARTWAEMADENMRDHLWALAWRRYLQAAGASVGPMEEDAYLRHAWAAWERTAGRTSSLEAE